MPRLPLLIPVRHVRPQRGRFQFAETVTLACCLAEDRLPLSLLAGDLEAMDVEADLTRSATAAAALRIRRDRAIAHADGYRLDIRPDGIVLTSRTAAGAYYGVATLRDLLAACGNDLPCGQIDDEPAFARRGIYHDVSRGKVPKLTTLLRLVEQLARWKINELQLYVENVFTFQKHPLIGKGYSPLTPDDLLRLQDHCKAHHVHLVGSLATFGHMEKILQIPQYQPLGELPGHRGWPGGTTLCPTDPGSILLVEDLCEEFISLFEAEDFNVCGDEPWELGQGRSKALATKVGVGQVYLEFLLKIHAICTRHGKRMNAWSDIVLDHPQLLGSLPQDVVMLNWEYAPAGGRIDRTDEIAAKGLPLVVCPGTNAWNSHGCRQAMGAANIARFARAGAAAGAEGLLNTDWGDNGHRNMLAVSLRNFAFGAAAAWHPEAVDEDGFTRRFVDMSLGGDDDARLAEAIDRLGSAHEDLGLPCANDTLTYFTLSQPQESFLGDSRRGRTLDAVDPAALRERARRLEKLSWPRTRPGNGFIADSIAEFGLATGQEIAACWRGIALQAIRQGRRPAKDVTENYLKWGRLLADGLPAAWALRNRPSRLRDELAMLETALADAEAWR